MANKTLLVNITSTTKKTPQAQKGPFGGQLQSNWQNLILIALKLTTTTSANSEASSLTLLSLPSKQQNTGN